MRRRRGFTLIEMLATIGVMAILATLAAPSFLEIAERNRLVTYANDLISSINITRSEAIRRALPVTLCPSADGLTCGGTWNDGWITFVNADDDSPAAVDEGEDVLRVHEALSPGYTLSPNPVFADHITYRSDGSANDAGVFAICHEGHVAGARAVILTQLRPRVARDTDNDRIPNTDIGNIADCVNP